MDFQSNTSSVVQTTTWVSFHRIQLLIPVPMTFSTIRLPMNDSMAPRGKPAFSEAWSFPDLLFTSSVTDG